MSAGAVFAISYAVLAGFYLALVLAQSAERRAWNAERAQHKTEVRHWARVALSRHAGEAVAALAERDRAPREKRQRSEDEPPPGVQPVGLDG